MRKIRIALLIIFAITFTAIPIGLFMFVQAEPVDSLETLRLGPDFRTSNLPIQSERPSVHTSGELRTSQEIEPDEYYSVGDTQWWLTLDDYFGWYYWAVFELRAINELAEVWVALNLSYGWYGGYGGIPFDTFDDPRADPIVTDEQVEYLLNAFTTTIYPIDTSYFGTPDFHDGNYGFWPEDYNGSSRNVILVSNFKDDAYYDPEYPYYIAGFYSPTFEYYIDRNIISIDSHNWEDRIGPDVPRPYLYEALIAHEYQHLIHDDYNPYDASFMNEGCSMIAEFLCGYPVAWGDINSYLATPDNSLTEWGDQGGINILADYGQSLLWALYLQDHFGGAAFLSHFVQAGIPGIAGIEAALEIFGYDMTFNEVFRDFRIANLIHTDYPGCGRYNYDSIDLGSEDADPIRVYDVTKKYPKNVLGTSFGTTITVLGYDTGISMVSSYGSDYIKFKNPGSKWFSFFKFDGDDDVPIPKWVYENGMWYSTPGGALYNLPLYYEVDPELFPDTTLTFDTYFDIEDYWDFGFVQYSIDGGETWISLANDYTTTVHDPNAWPEAIDNLPGITGWTAYYTEDPTMPMSFELPAEVLEEESYLLCFRYMTDWGTEYEGWYIDNVVIGEVALNEADFFTPSNPETDFMVTFIRVGNWRGRTHYWLIDDLTTDDVTEEGTMWMLPYGFGKADMYMIVSPLLGPADYEFTITKGHFPRPYHCHCW